MRIFLTGFMGSGKTTLGAKLASKLSYPFIDLDKKIEEEAGMSIREYFGLYGENTFRELEKKVLQNAAYPENAVIATGGGAPCFFDNMDWMNKNGVTIYLSMSPKALASRLEKGKDERPLIKDLSRDELVDFIASKLEQRNPFYQQAKYILEGSNITAAKVTEFLKEKGILI